jgi:hypothetical protein
MVENAIPNESGSNWDLPSGDLPHLLDRPIKTINTTPFIMVVHYLIQVDIGGHPPFPTHSKKFFGNFGNLLFLAVFNFRDHFEGLNEGFLG